jgi:protein-L-isoaspartate(D-aspartate) O-methyltransferase
MNVEQARFNMVEQQIRTWEVLDQDVLDLLFEVKREAFVPPEYRDLAFVDMEIPIGHGQAMMQPKVEARLLQELAARPHETAYEVGTGSGYFTALLARRVKHVTSAEIFPGLQAAAAVRLARAGLANVTLLGGDSAQAPLTAAPFDLIVLTGSTPLLPEAFAACLNEGGRLIAVVGEAPVMKALLLRKGASGALHTAELFETQLAPLVNAARASRFRF